MTNDKKPTGIAKKDPTTNKASVVQDFWSSSAYEMDNSAAQSQLSASSVSMSNPNLDGHCSSGSNPPEFVNHGMFYYIHQYAFQINQGDIFLSDVLERSFYGGLCF